MKVYNADGSELMQITSIDSVGDKLEIVGTLFGAMPMAVRISPKDAREGLKLLNLRKIVFILSLLWRQ